MSRISYSLCSQKEPYRFGQCREGNNCSRNIHILGLADGGGIHCTTANPDVSNFNHLEGKITVRNVDQLTLFYRCRQILVGTGEMGRVTLNLVVKVGQCD